MTDQQKPIDHITEAAGDTPEEEAKTKPKVEAFCQLYYLLLTTPCSLQLIRLSRTQRYA